MKNVVFLFLLLAGFAAKAQDSSNVTNRILWNDWYKLEWSDFQAEPNEDEHVAALSSIALPYTYLSDGEGVMNIEVQVCFIKDNSWSKEELRNKVLLQHEQLHFDIAEIHRRMIVKEILEAKFTKENHKELLKEIINRVWVKNYRAMQDKYDAETNYSRVFKQQIKWNKYVKQQLVNLEEYTFTEIEVSLISFD